jgi:RNA:NAD 2'-phosphotransferase (TPT1/KptA family)
MTMYHGTTKDNYNLIKETGILNSHVYLTPEKQIAVDYAANNSADYVVIEIEVDESLFQADREFVSGMEENWVEESLDNGSIYVDCNVEIKNATITVYEDYEELN